MSLFAKSAAGILGAGGISVAGCYALGMFETKFLCLMKEEGDWSTEYSPESKSNVGKAYGYLLVGTYSKGNKKWWEKSYSKYQKETDASLSTEFKTSGKAKSGFANKETTEGGPFLNKLCETVYKKTLTDITPSSGDTNKGLLEKNLWKFCSPLEKKPISLKDSAEEGNAYKAKETSSSESNKSKLVSVKSKDNNSFWVLKNEWFHHLKTEPTDKFFKSRKEQGKPIKDICQEAYGLAKVDGDQEENSPKEDNVIKYCSLQATVY